MCAFAISTFQTSNWKCIQENCDGVHHYFVYAKDDQC